MHRTKDQKYQCHLPPLINSGRIDEDDDYYNDANEDTIDAANLNLSKTLDCNDEVTVPVELTEFQLLHLFPTIVLPSVNIKGYTIKITLQFDRINEDNIQAVAQVDIDKHSSMIMWQCKLVTAQESNFDQWQSCEQPLQLGYFNRAVSSMNLNFAFRGLIYEKIKYLC